MLQQGIGKTMVAGVACDRILDEFECFVFLDKIGEANLLGLQKRLLQILINVEGWNMYDDTNTNINEIKSSLCRKKILLVLDGVTEKEQIDNFAAGERTSFHSGSRILITTRDQKLLKVLNVDDKYIVNGLSPNEALQLFCHHAFKSDSKQGYEELCKSLIHYAGGYPLALEKFGSYLSAKSKDQWHKILDKLVRSPYFDCIDGVYSSLSFP
ncbi:hypothetical protein NL676_015872 [Syzygium grande]|nr:hypothetical protein NL676_015872 [Syzygium grande]